MIISRGFLGLKLLLKDPVLKLALQRDQQGESSSVPIRCSLPLLFSLFFFSFCFFIPSIQFRNTVCVCATERERERGKFFLIHHFLPFLLHTLQFLSLSLFFFMSLFTSNEVVELFPLRRPFAVRGNQSFLWSLNVYDRSMLISTQRRKISCLFTVKTSNFTIDQNIFLFFFCIWKSRSRLQ